MDKQNIITLQERCNQTSSILKDTHIEYWYARDLQKDLGQKDKDEILDNK